MYQITSIMCVVAGYNIENVSFEKAVEIGKEVLKQTSIKEAKVIPMIMAYPRKYGAPKGGEVGVSFELETDDLSVVEEIKKISILLGQIDSSVSVYQDGVIDKVYFIHNEFNQIGGKDYEDLLESHMYYIDPHKYTYIEYIVETRDLYETSAKIQYLLENEITDCPVSLKIENKDDHCYIMTHHNPYHYKNDNAKELMEKTVKSIMERI